MNFTNPLFIILFSTGIVFFLTAWITFKFPPEKINNLYGYRTRRSMRNQDTWNYAQKYSSKEMLKLGGVLILSSLFGLFFDLGEVIGTVISLVLIIFTCVILIYSVEKSIKKKFGNE